MTTVGLEQHGSEAVGPGFEPLLCQIFLRFRTVTPPPSTTFIHKIFRYQEVSETQKGSPTKFFGTVRQQISDGKLWHSLPSSPILSMKFFDTRNFLKHSSISLTKFFGTVRQKKFDRKSWYAPLVHKIFRYSKLVKHLRVPLWKFRYWHMKKSTENCATPPPDWKSWYPPHAKKFSSHETLSNREGSPRKFFGEMRHKFFLLRIVIFSFCRHLIEGCFPVEVPSFENGSGDDDNSNITSNCNVVDKESTASCFSSSSEHTVEEDNFSSTSIATSSLSADDHAANDDQQPTISSAIWLPTTTSIRSIFTW